MVNFRGDLAFTRERGYYLTGLAESLTSSQPAASQTERSALSGNAIAPIAPERLFTQRIFTVSDLVLVIQSITLLLGVAAIPKPDCRFPVRAFAAARFYRVAHDFNVPRRDRLFRAFGDLCNDAARSRPVDGLVLSEL